MPYPTNPKQAYRPEVDGLRALAVLPVLIYHLSGGGWLAGGFLGVDVFFVISGYLITRILIRDFSGNAAHALRAFWARRIRRIFPLLGVVVLATTIASWLLLAPKALREYIGSGFAATLSYSNLFFWSEDSYIAEASTTKPLLHTWSLAVEEQFYIVYPVVLLLAFRLLRKPAVALWVLLVLSLGTSVWVSTFDASFNFFSFTSRGWELGAGALVALGASRSSSKLAALGLVLIAIGYVVVNDTFWHPSPTWTLLPVVGAVLVIRYAAADNIVGRILSWRPMVAVGLISFGIYLWHWPVIAFFNYENLSGLLVTVVEIVLPIALATLTYFFVERPMRSRTLVPTRRFVVLTSALLLAIVSALTFTAANASTTLRLGGSASFYQSLERSDLEAICGSADDKALFENGYCKIGATSAKPDFVLVGDSHTLSLLNEFDLQAQDSGRSGLFAYQPGCPPLLDVYVDRVASQKDRCHEWNQRLAQLLTAGDYKTLFLVARWNFYFDDIPTVRIASTPNGFDSDSRDNLREALEASVGQYAKQVDEVVIFEDIPPQSDKPELLYKSSEPLASLAIKTPLFAERNAKFRAILAQIPFASNVRVFDPTPYLCNDSICPIGTKKQSFYFDDDHLSMAGAARLAKPISELLGRG